MRRRTTVVVATLVLTTLAPGATMLAQDTSTTPATSAVPASPKAIPATRDLYLDMPYNLGGFEPDIVMTRGAEHLANLQVGDPEDDRTRAELEGLLAQVDAGIDDMVSGYALASQEDFFSFVVAIRIGGIEPGTLLPAYLPILYRELEDATTSDAIVAGKDVLAVTSLGEGDEEVDLYVYDAGDTIWLVQGPEDVVEVVLGNLP